MVDSDDKSGEDNDIIGEVVTTMGSLMGAKKQTFTADLSHQGKQNRGQLIVRTQAIEQSNLVACMQLTWQNVHNVAGGCLGMCQDPTPYVCRIMKSVVGQDDRFVTVAQVPGQYNTAQARMPFQEVPLAQLCSVSNKQERLKICLQT